jgi:hypothetical protein
MLAADMGAGQAEILADELGRAHARRYGTADCAAIDGQIDDGNAFHHITSPLK